MQFGFGGLSVRGSRIMTNPQAVPGFAAKLGRNHIGLEALGPELLLHLLRPLVVHYRVDLDAVRMPTTRRRRRRVRRREPLVNRLGRSRRSAVVLGLVTPGSVRGLRRRRR